MEKAVGARDASPRGGPVWQEHLALWARLRREAAWKNNFRLRDLALAYRDCFSARLEPRRLDEIRSLLGRASTGGKHKGYQAVWGWSALGYQLMRFHGDFLAAREAIERAFVLVPGLVTGNDYGHWTPCAEGVWVLLLVNDARLDLHFGEKESGVRKLGALSDFLDGAELEAGLFGQTIRRAYLSRDYRFAREPALLDFLRQEIEAVGGWVGEE